MKRRLFIFLLLPCLLSPSALYGKVVTQRSSTRPVSQTPATAAASAKLPEAKLVSQVLPNGLEVIILEDHSIPLVTIALAVDGSYTEPPELNGLSHL